MIALGGSNAWREWRKKGGVVVVLQWLAIPTGIEGEPDSVEPCMILRHANNQTHRGCWVIPLDSAWMYNEPLHMARRGRQAAIQIGLGDSSMAVFAVIDAVQSHLEDLVKMPPAPDGLLKKAVAIGECMVRENKREVASMIVRADGSLTR